MRGRRVLVERAALCARLHAVGQEGTDPPPPLRRWAAGPSRRSLRAGCSDLQITGHFTRRRACGARRAEGAATR